MRSTFAAAVLAGMVFFLCGVTAGAAERPVLLVVGDSLSAAYKIPVEKGWVHLLSERLAARGYAYHVVNASISGDTTAGGLVRLPGELKRRQPAIVVIELGGNDGLQGLPPSQMQANLARMVELAQKAGAKVLLVGVRMPPNYGPAFAKRFEAVYREVAKAKNVPLVPELMKGVVSHPELMQERGIHPRAAAEPKLLDNVWPALEPLLAKPRSGAGAHPPTTLSNVHANSAPPNSIAAEKANVERPRRYLFMGSSMGIFFTPLVPQRTPALSSRRIPGIGKDAGKAVLVRVLPETEGVSCRRK